MSLPVLGEQPVEWTARLARSLRESGVPCTVLESLTACDCLPELDSADALDVYFGMKAAFTTSADQQPAFDRCFWELWGETHEEAAGAEAAADASAPLQTRVSGEKPPRTTVLERLRRADAIESSGDSPPEVVGGTYSATERLTERSFERMDERELRRVDRVLDRILLRLSTRRSRRYRPHRRTGRPDLRRSFRDMVAHDGEVVRLARRVRRLERPRVVLLCDVSGSMERFSRFLLRFLLAAGRERDVESFVFSTRLTRLTPWLAVSRVDEALSSLGARVHDWSGGTRIGECLDQFVREFGRSLLGQKTVVVILSDGLDRGDIELLERAMGAIRRKSRKVIWLNPLLAGSEYQPVARGMKAALPHVDVFAPGHNLESLLELERHLTLA